MLCFLEFTSANQNVFVLTEGEDLRKAIMLWTNMNPNKRFYQWICLVFGNPTVGPWEEHIAYTLSGIIINTIQCHSKVLQTLHQLFESTVWSVPITFRHNNTSMEVAELTKTHFWICFFFLPDLPCSTILIFSPKGIKGNWIYHKVGIIWWT